MTSKPRLCFVALDHQNDEFLEDLVAGIRIFCPDAEVVWYDSGSLTDLATLPGVVRLPVSRPLQYAKVTPFFLDVFEWASGQHHDYIVNVESDMAFINPGFDTFLQHIMADCDYLAPRLARSTPTTSKWRPYRSLRRELPELLDIVGLGYTNAAFSPGQVFTSRFIDTVVGSSCYAELRAFVEANQAPDRSFTLQEVLLPTLADAMHLRAKGYPPHLDALNRYRPYHAGRAVVAAHTRGDVHFVHPVRRDASHAARRFVRSLHQNPAPVAPGVAK